MGMDLVRQVYLFLVLNMGLMEIQALSGLEHDNWATAELGPFRCLMTRPTSVAPLYRPIDLARLNSRIITKLNMDMKNEECPVGWESRLSLGWLKVDL